MTDEEHQILCDLWLENDTNCKHEITWDKMMGDVEYKFGYTKQ